MGEDTSNDTAQSLVIDRLRTIVAEAKQGKAEALPRLRQRLDDHPEIWRHYGDLDVQVTAKWIGLLAGDDCCVHESLKRRVDAWRTELQTANDSPLEQLLVARIITSWLQVRFLDSAVALAAEGAPTTQARFMDQQLHRAEKRHIEAIRALAEVRKLLP